MSYTKFLCDVLEAAIKHCNNCEHLIDYRFKGDNWRTSTAKNTSMICQDIMRVYPKVSGLSQ